MYRLRQLLGDDRISSEPGGYVLRAEPTEIDAARFEAMVKAAKANLSSEPSEAAAALSDALELWRAAPLADLANEPSLRGEIARLEELHLSATEHRIAAEIDMGGHSTVVSELDALTAQYPFRERMWANLMLALYRLGRQAEALATYQRARPILIGGALLLLAGGSLRDRADRQALPEPVPSPPPDHFEQRESGSQPMDADPEPPRPNVAPPD